MPEGPGCRVGDLFRLLGKAHTLDLLGLFIDAPGPLRFVDVQRRLRLSPNTLSERLKELTEAGLLSRAVFGEIPPRVDYEATPKARALRPVFAALTSWAAEHDLKPVAPARQAVAPA